MSEFTVDLFVLRIVSLKNAVSLKNISAWAASQGKAMI